jgi:BirA family biotin operon repressor/biotin-[acetyl-CoA-carboxylase] ligase
VRLTAGADPVSATRLQTGLTTTALGRRLERHIETESTNDLALSAALAGAVHGAVYLAEHQSKGRGRQGRTWHSPPGTGLWFSLVLRFPLPVGEAWRITLGAGVAVAEAARSLGVDAQVKWPNDVLADGRKLAGVLTETRTEGRTLAFSVLGIGVNVNQDREDFPPDLRRIATSLKAESGRHTDRTEFLCRALNLLEELLGEIPGPSVRERWKALYPHWGERVRVETSEGACEGAALDLNEDGALVIATQEGRRLVHAGDVVMSRRS